MPNTPNHSKAVYGALNAIPSPCKGCEKRSVGCHSSCARYKVWTCRINAEKERIWNAYGVERMMEDYEVRRNERKKKRYGKR